MTSRLSPAFADGSVTVYHGDVREVLRLLPAASIDCCVTSPPYWGLRDYGLPPSTWGGDFGCPHRWGRWAESHDQLEPSLTGPPTWPPGPATTLRSRNSAHDE